MIAAGSPVVYLDCIAGAAGDMLLAALLDAGASLTAVQAAVRACGVDEVSITVAEVRRAGVRGLHLEITETGAARERGLTECLAAVAAAGLRPSVSQQASAVLRALGEAEAALHGVSTDHIHLHELSAADTLVDVVGVCAALESLGSPAVHASALPAASGSIETAHGRIPVPAPATLHLLAAAAAPLVPGDAGVEQVTPTAAALLAVLADFCVPAMRLRSVGHGAGSRDDPRRPNLVRCWAGEALGSPGATSPGAFDDACVELRTNLDDATPAVVAELAEHCLTAGALDVWVVAATMKKGRPGHVLHALVPAGAEVAIAALLLAQSPTLGVRRTPADRMVAGRDSTTVDLPDGPVRVKRKLIGGRVVDARPEFEDCWALAARSDRPLHQVVDQVTAAVRAALVPPPPALPTDTEEIL